MLERVPHAPRSAPAPRAHGPWIGPGDDAAVAPLGDTVTVDTLVEGVHWDDRLAPADVGYKSLAVSVSDLAAMGASPRWAVLSLALPECREAWTRAFAQGLGEAAARWGVALIGGDTVRGPGRAVVTLTVGGALVAAPLRRNAARPGDVLWVTGRLGLAGAGWRRTAPTDEALRALRRPDPPLAFALALARAGLAHAAMDLSDGLYADLLRLCEASGVGAEVRAADLPGADALDGPLHPETLRDQCVGGEDYGLLFTAPLRATGRLRALAAAYDLHLTDVGRVTPGPAVTLRGAPWPAPTFEHFRAPAPQERA